MSKASVLTVLHADIPKRQAHSVSDILSSGIRCLHTSLALPSGCAYELHHLQEIHVHVTKRIFQLAGQFDTQSTAQALVFADELIHSTDLTQSNLRYVIL